MTRGLPPLGSPACPPRSRPAVKPRFFLSVLLFLIPSVASATEPVFVAGLFEAGPGSQTPATVSAAAPLHFENDILPILARHGCSSSGCHGKAEGQGGFKLSIFASDPEADYAALT